MNQISYKVIPNGLFHNPYPDTDFKFDNVELGETLLEGRSLVESLRLRETVEEVMSETPGIDGREFRLYLSQQGLEEFNRAVQDELGRRIAESDSVTFTEVRRQGEIEPREEVDYLRMLDQISEQDV